MANEGWGMRVGIRAALAAAIALSVVGCSMMDKVTTAVGQRTANGLFKPSAPAKPAASAVPVAKAAPAADALTMPAPQDNAATPDANTLDTVVATVDGNPITEHDLKAFSASGQGSALGVAPAHPDDPADVLKALITQRMLEQEALKYSDKVGEDDVDRFISNMEQQQHMTDEQLRAQLKQHGMSYPEFRATMRKQVMAMTMIDREVRQKVVIPESEIQDYYKTNKDEFSASTNKYKLAQILIAAPASATPAQSAAAGKKASDVRQQAMKGLPFDTLALQYSDDDSKSKGGELGWFAPEDLNDSIAAAIKNMKPGDISAVVHTKYGYHIVKVEDHQTPGAKPYDEVKGAIRDKLATQQAKETFEKWVDQDLVKQHYVETMY
jgi:parvulin-like peptidyl-prolyl isomerase